MSKEEQWFEINVLTENEDIAEQLQALINQHIVSLQHNKKGEKHAITISINECNDIGTQIRNIQEWNKE